MDGALFEAKKKKKAPAQKSGGKKKKAKSRKPRPLKQPFPILRKARPYGAVNGGFRKRRRGPSRVPSAKAKANARLRRLEQAYESFGGRDNYLTYKRNLPALSRKKASATLDMRRSARDAERDKAATMKR